MAHPQFDQPTNAAAIWLPETLSFTLGRLHSRDKLCAVWPAVRRADARTTSKSR